MLEVINVTPVDRSQKEGGRRSRNSCVSELCCEQKLEAKLGQKLGL